ncbi:GntR family transcriptional regulator [Ottowia oryzae]|uniref:GntR family transcriptional regulator n=1 Tax=Ottowia oryzae TaxID=2109914 RepID=A0A2S0MFM1_9BURK|nr:GntR family transcriptional regulator [Ottowia oryzae]AVO34617.1 GntR family transcriptional regulator [Ottowia oryzae]
MGTPQIHYVLDALRQRILSRAVQPGQRLVELDVAAQLNVSRTPVRLAFEQLVREGYLEQLPRRGFRVRTLTPRDFSEAIDVRGVLEGMAARLVAERGASPALLTALHACVAEGAELLAGAERHLGDAAFSLAPWVPLNARFHGELVAAADNAALASALEHVARAPMASATALAIGQQPTALELAFLQRAQQDHEDIVQALSAREAGRAESLLREHAYRSRINKQRLFATT